MQFYSCRATESRQDQFAQVSYVVLRTLQFALNGSQGWGINKKSYHAIVDIKKGATYQVEGMKKLREIGQKFGIQAI